MRKKIILILAIIALISCKKEEVDYAIFSGKIVNTEKTELDIIGDRYIRFGKTLKIQEDGSFHDTLRLPKWNTNYSTWVLGNSINFHVRKGDHIMIHVDTTNSENSVTFSGTAASINKYILSKKEVEKKFLPKKTRISSFEEDEFIQKINELKNKLIANLSASENIPEEFAIQEKKDLEYDVMRKIGMYQFFHGRIIKNDSFKASQQLWDSFFTYDFENLDQFEKSYIYRDLVYGRLRNLSSLKRKQLKEDGIKKESAIVWLNTIFEKTKNPIIRETIFKSSLIENMKSTMSQNLKTTCFNYYMDNASNEAFKSEAQGSYEEAKKLWKGSPSPKFVGYRNHAGGTNSLDDFKGKYVYIDVWATWCGPCKAQIPYLKEVEKKYHDKNIEFVSISVDKKKDTKKWEKMVVDKELGGVHLLADHNFNSEFIKAYNITGIPRFILIDPEGNIISQNAPRPSQEKLINLFNELNI